jgi:hypothetical protein
MLWIGNECGNSKATRISRQPFPVKIMVDERTTTECGIF